MAHKKRQKRVVRTLYWYVLPVGDEETRKVQAFFQEADQEAQYAVSPSKCWTVRVPRRIISREELTEELPGIGVTPEDEFSYLHDKWVDLKPSSK